MMLYELPGELGTRLQGATNSPPRSGRRANLITAVAERDRTVISTLENDAQVLGADSGSDPRGRRRLDIF